MEIRTAARMRQAVQSWLHQPNPIAGGSHHLSPRAAGSHRLQPQLLKQGSQRSKSTGATICVQTQRANSERTRPRPSETRSHVATIPRAVHGSSVLHSLPRLHDLTQTNGQRQSTRRPIEIRIPGLAATLADRCELTKKKGRNGSISPARIAVIDLIEHAERAMYRVGCARSITATPESPSSPGGAGQPGRRMAGQAASLRESPKSPERPTPPSQQDDD